MLISLDCVVIVPSAVDTRVLRLDNPLALADTPVVALLTVDSSAVTDPLRLVMELPWLTVNVSSAVIELLLPLTFPSVVARLLVRFVIALALLAMRGSSRLTHAEPVSVSYTPLTLPTPHPG